MLLQSIFAAIIPAVIYTTIIYYADRYEKEPIWLLAATFIWGAIPAIIFALIFNLIFGLPFYLLLGDWGDVAVASIVAPLVEESIKGAALLIILFFWRHEIDGLLDGIIYGAMVGMGFAMVENVFYFEQVFAEGGREAWQFNIFLRAFVFGLNHSLYSAMTGLGVAYSRLSPNPIIKWGAPFLGWSAAVFLHFVHNAVASSGDALGAFVCIPLLVNAWGGVIVTVIIIIWALSQERRWIKQHLKHEVAAGIITMNQYEKASSSIARLSHRFSLLFSAGLSSYLRARRFYLKCSQLAYSKQHYMLLKDDKSLARVQQLRGEVSELGRGLG